MPRNAYVMVHNVWLVYHEVDVTLRVPVANIPDVFGVCGIIRGQTAEGPSVPKHPLPKMPNRNVQMLRVTGPSRALF